MAGDCLNIGKGHRLPYMAYNDSCWNAKAGREIAPNTGANAPKFFTLAAKSWKLVAKLATNFHNLTKRYSE